MLESQNTITGEKFEFNKISCEKRLSTYLAVMFEASITTERNQTFKIQNLVVLTSTWNQVFFWDE